jgi:16S rRNA processing protein RimM
VELVVGRIVRAHGIRGEVTVNVLSDQPELRFVPGAKLGAGTRSLVIKNLRWHGPRLLVTFEGVADRNAAEALRGTSLVADVPDDEELDDPDEFFDHQLAGLRAETGDGELIGEVTEVLHLPMQDVLAVRMTSGREVLVPFVASIVPTVDVAGGRVVVAPPEGLFDEDLS